MKAVEDETILKDLVSIQNIHSLSFSRKTQELVSNKLLVVISFKDFCFTHFLNIFRFYIDIKRYVSH